MLILRKNLTRPLTWDELDRNQEMLIIDEWLPQTYTAKQNVIVVSGDTTTIYHCLQCHSADVYAPENTFKRYYGEIELWMPIGSTYNGYPSNTDIYVTGMTYSPSETGNTLTVYQTVGYPPVSVQLPFYSLYDHYTTSLLLSGTTLTAVRNGSLPNLTVDLSPLVDIATGITHTDYYVTGATLNHSTYVLSLRRNDGGLVTVNLSSLRDGNYYTTGATLSGTTLTFRKNVGASYSVDLAPILTGATGGGSIIIHQTGHSFNVMDVVRAEYNTPDTFVLAQADNEWNADIVGVVSSILDADRFVLTIDGEITSANVPNEPIGTFMFLSPYIPGELTDTEPTAIGEISVPVGVILEPATRFLVIHNRGSEIVQPFTGGTSGYSGYSGIGYSGSDGASGYSGYSGIGYSGSDGASGYSGYSGYSGSGVSGYSGYSGISGAMGLSYYSAGATALPTFSDNGGGNFTIGSGTYNFYTNTGATGELEQFTITGATLDAPSGTTSYCVANYNGGNPYLEVITDVSLIKETTILPVYTMFYCIMTDAIDYLAWDTLANALSNKLNRRFVKTQRFARESGFMISEVATRKVAITGGNVWYGAVEETFDDFLSDATGCTFREWVYYTTGWTPTIVTQYDNLSYQGANGKTALDNNKYAVVWVYKKIATNTALGNTAGYILSTSQFDTVGDALNSDIPTSIPPIFSSFGMLVGRLVIQENVSAAEIVESAFDHAYVGGVAGNSGYSGYSGKSGYSGYSGKSGYSGYSGSGNSGYSGYSGSGTSGYSGYSGISGYSGQDGSAVASGYSGYSGESNVSGYSGYSGISGFSGYSGYSGISGDSGYSGYSGISGESGYSGYSGISGASGYSGYSGFSGYSGYSGVSGYSGYSGVSGYSGYSGISGESGYSGYSGISGFSGYSGYSGRAGNSGFITDATFFMDVDTDTVYAKNLTIGSGTSGTLQYRDGNQGTGKVLSSDANGNASWSSGAFSGYSGYSGVGSPGDAGSSGFSGYSGYSGVATINNYGDNRVTTATSQATELNAETGFTYDASKGIVTVEFDEPAELNLKSYGTGKTSPGLVTSEAPTIVSLRGRGTSSSKKPVLTNDKLYEQYFYAMYGSGTTVTTYSRVGGIFVEAKGNYNTANPILKNRYVISTSNTDATQDVLEERFIIETGGTITANFGLNVRTNVSFETVSYHTGDTTLGDGFSYLADVGASTVNFTLPSAASCQGRLYYICLNTVSGGSLVIRRDGSDSIAWTAGNVTLTVAHKYALLQSDGISNWLPISYNV